MTVRCFVDASVLLHARDARDPLKQSRAAEWLERLWQQRSGRTSVQALSEFYFTATRKLTPRVPEDLAWDEVVRYLAWAPQATDEALLRRAREIERRYHLAWWDCTEVAAALRLTVELLPFWYDVDLPSDLQRVRHRTAEWSPVANHTRAWLEAAPHREGVSFEL